MLYQVFAGNRHLTDGVLHDPVPLHVAMGIVAYDKARTKETDYRIAPAYGEAAWMSGARLCLTHITQHYTIKIWEIPDLSVMLVDQHGRGYAGWAELGERGKSYQAGADLDKVFKALEVDGDFFSTAVWES
jgi:hypothetical protein